MINKHLIKVLIILITSNSYSNDIVDLDSNLWKLATSNAFCKSRDFKNVDANIMNEKGQTPLMIASQHNNSQFINCMRKAKANVYIKDFQGKTAFDYINKAKSKRENIFNIQTYNALKNVEVHQIIGTRANIVSSYIDFYKKIHTIFIKGEKCEAFTLPSNVQCTYIETIKKTINMNDKYISDINRGVPPIFAAIQNHLYKQLFELLDSGADIEMKNNFAGTPLIFALRQYDDKLVKILLEYGANPNAMHGHGLYSTLSKLCVTNRISTIKLLLEYGADVNYQYKKSETALTVAAKECKNFELVKLLLDKGADPTIMDKYHRNTITGLRRYCGKDSPYDEMKALLEEGL